MHVHCPRSLFGEQTWNNNDQHMHICTPFWDRLFETNDNYCDHHIHIDTGLRVNVWDKQWSHAYIHCFDSQCIGQTTITTHIHTLLWESTYIWDKQRSPHTYILWSTSHHMGQTTSPHVHTLLWESTNGKNNDHYTHIYTALRITVWDKLQSPPHKHTCTQFR